MWFIILLKAGAEDAIIPREITELDGPALHPYLFGIVTDEIIQLAVIPSEMARYPTGDPSLTPDQCR
jgi:hypothetical protein